ncbi:hypothetical protein J0895_04245 [Phormidium pseudopriestleyi FRX01]|uniref:Uncharacterized protein n=1 Tax=Phormidium pseudopriestleyi FRX01 TaxID=1759528 RepID=A0ABS3FPP0_9CYAN|nr:hypothetical protein [Phormidium pseudopriestleyi]MBO0348327.1 hypothetical protein [Phormidium pseudopriestleyi FRX01]
MNCTCQEFETHYPDCTSCSDGKIITAQENGRKYILNNSSHQRVCKVRVDDCVITSQEQCKCDYLFIVCSPEQVEDENLKSSEQLYFIELKGKDLIHAVEQLTQTLEHFKPQINQAQVFARVVLSKSPPIKSIENDAKVVRLKKLLKKYQGNFQYGSRQYENDFV